ncbi:MAG: hypothetical protein QXI68_02205 [Sulfolobales archaeon]
MSVRKIIADLTVTLSPTEYKTLSNPVYGRYPLNPIQVSFYGSGVINIFNAPDTFTPTWGADYVNKDYAYDTDLNSYAYISVGTSVPETIALTVDYGVSKERYLFLKFGSASNVLRKYVYLSVDGSTWTQIYNAYPAGTVTLIRKDIFRYVRISYSNASSTAGDTSYIYEVNAFDVSNPSYSKTITQTDGIISDEIILSRYWVWVEPSPSLTLSIIEEGLPSRGTKILIK